MSILSLGNLAALLSWGNQEGAVLDAAEKEKKAIANKWLSLGLPPVVLNRQWDCAHFLITSGLAYSLVGLANSTDAPGPHGIMMQNGQPYLKVEGQWENWENVKERIRLHHEWNCVSPDGLIPQGRLNYKRIYPVHILSEDHYQAVWNQAMRFLDATSDVDPLEEKKGVLQLMTSHHDRLVSPFWLEHCTIRLIIPRQGRYEVYSLGAEMSEEQFRMTRPGSSVYSTSILTTVETKIGMCDFEEFRPKDLCRVTSVPLTSERAQKILDKIQSLSERHIRFNYLQQNCLCLVHEIYKETGYEFPDLRMKLSELLWKKISGKRKLVPDCHLLPMSIVGKISTLASNALIMLLGGWKMSMPLPDGAAEEKFSENHGLISFSKLVRSARSLWEEETSSLYHSDPLIKWQLAQPSTFVVSAKEAPKMVILP